MKRVHHDTTHAHLPEASHSSDTSRYYPHGETTGREIRDFAEISLALFQTGANKERLRGVASKGLRMLGRRSAHKKFVGLGLETAVEEG